jgi:predicted TIM-barrel fold metal-dependent hydrolase
MTVEATATTRAWSSLRVIDAHTHAFSPDLLAERDRHVERDFWFGELYRNPAALAIHADDLLASTIGAGIDRAILCGFPWSDEGICRQENSYLAAAAQASGGRLAWLGTVVPGHPDAVTDATWCIEQGAAGIGELNADGQRADLDKPDIWRPLIEVARAAGRPLMLHASEGPGHRYPGKGTATPDRLVRWLANAQEIDVVFAHWGGGLPFYELMPEVALAARNVVYDSAASSYLYRPAVFRAVLDIVGPERVLWASDHPVLGMRRFLGRTRREAMIEPEEAAAVMAGNARRVYRLPDVGHPRAGTTP